MKNVLLRLACCWIAFTIEVMANSVVSVIAYPSVGGDGLDVSYTIISDSKLSCRYVNMVFYPSRRDYELDNASGTCFWSGAGRTNVGNGIHNLTFDTKVVLGLSISELVRNYPEGVVLLELVDSCGGLYAMFGSECRAVSNPISGGRNPPEPAVTFSSSSAENDGVIKKEYHANYTVDNDSTYSAAHTLGGVLYDEVNQLVAGTMTLKLSEAKNEKVKVKGTVSLFSGRKLTVSKSMPVGEDSIILDMLPFKKPIGNLDIEIESDDVGKLTFFATGDNWTVKAADLGGKLENTKELSFKPQVGDMDLPSGYSLLIDPSEAVPIYVKNGVKWACGKFPTLRYIKYKTQSETSYTLMGLGDEKRPNVTALELNYTPKTGIFSGMFKIFISNEKVAVGKPKLKSYTARVKGVMSSDGHGQGIATIKIGKKSYVWPVEVSKVLKP